MAGVIIIDPRKGAPAGITTGDELALGVFQDIENDVLYFTDGSKIYQWEGDSGNSQSYVWKTGQIRLPKKVNLGAAIVEADSFSSLTFKLYVDISGTMTLKHTQTVTSSEPFRLPGGFLSNIFEVQLEGTDTVTRVSCAENIWELAEG